MSNRIDRIDGNKYYEYTKIKNLNVPDTDEKFSLDYRQDDPQSEIKKNKDKTEEGAETKQPEVHNGVRLDISNSARTDAAALKTRTNTAKEQRQDTFLLSAFLASVRDFVTAAVTTVKAFFYHIWNDPQPENENPETMEQIALREEIAENMAGTAGETDAEQSAAGLQPEAQFDTPMDALNAYQQHEERLDREIQPYLRSGDLNQVISLLTDNGRKAAAKNSTLLTYYDRNGRMVEPNASDRERILYGDRNTRKL